MPINNSGTYTGQGKSTNNGGLSVTGNGNWSSDFPEVALWVMGNGETSANRRNIAGHFQGTLSARTFYAKTGKPDNSASYGDDNFQCQLGRIWNPTNSTWEKNGVGSNSSRIPNVDSKNVFMTSGGGGAPLHAVCSAAALGGTNINLLFTLKSADKLYYCGQVQTNGNTRTIKLENAVGGSTGIVRVDSDPRNINTSVAIQDSTCSAILNVLEPKLLDLERGGKVISFEVGAARTALSAVATAAEREHFVSSMTIGETDDQTTLGDVTDENGTVIKADVAGPLDADGLADLADTYDLDPETTTLTWAANGNFSANLAGFDEIRCIPLLVGGHKANRARLDAIEGDQISLSDLKTVVAASSDFADFQSRIAAL